MPFMTVVCAGLGVTGVSRHSMLFVAGDRYVGRFVARRDGDRAISATSRSFGYSDHMK